MGATRLIQDYLCQKLIWIYHTSNDVDFTWEVFGKQKYFKSFHLLLKLEKFQVVLFIAIL